MPWALRVGVRQDPGPTHLLPLPSYDSHRCPYVTSVPWGRTALGETLIEQTDGYSPARE